MKQDNIWDFWQTDGDATFAGALPRLNYIAERVKPGTRALNIGIGSADLERILLANKVEVYSLDPSEASIARAGAFLADRAVVGRVEAIPFDDGFFDCVIMSEVLEHLDDSVRREGLEEVARVLKADGAFVGTVPDEENLLDNLVMCPCCEARFHRWGHVRSYSRESLTAELSAHFRQVSVKSVFMTDPWAQGLRRWIAGKVKSFASALNLGPYKAARNLYFCARATRLRS